MGWLASRRGWKGAAALVSHHEGAWGFRFWQSAQHEGVNEEKRRRKKSVFSSPAARPGEEERGTVSLKTTPFRFLFFP